MDIHRLKYPVAKMRQLILTELSEQELNGLEESGAISDCDVLYKKT